MWPLIDKRNQRGEAALKYFQCSLCYRVVLFGLSLIYGLTGTVLLKEIALFW